MVLKILSFVMKDIIKILKGYFRNKADVHLIFIFGSSVKGNLTEESDVDVAILFKHFPDLSEINQIRDELSNLIKREVDVVVLNNSSPIIRMQVLKNGVLLINKNKAIYNDFFVRTVKEYDDLKRVRKEIENDILKGRIYAR